MLIPLVDLPVSPVVEADKNAQLLDFVGHLGIMGPVLLHSESTSNESESASLEVLKAAINRTGCYIEGLTIDDDELATQLLDRGAHLVYFANGSESELQKKVLKSFSRARVGVSDVDKIASVESMTSVIEEYREFSGHFLFRYLSLLLSIALSTLTDSVMLIVDFRL
jgi:hypothetical protein